MFRKFFFLSVVIFVSLISGKLAVLVPSSNFGCDPSLNSINLPLNGVYELNSKASGAYLYSQPGVKVGGTTKISGAYNKPSSGVSWNLVNVRCSYLFAIQNNETAEFLTASAIYAVYSAKSAYLGRMALSSLLNPPNQLKNNSLWIVTKLADGSFSIKNLQYGFYLFSAPKDSSVLGNVYVSNVAALSDNAKWLATSLAGSSNSGLSYPADPMDDYTSHPCIRDCSNTQPMQCVYNFSVEWYYVMSRNCFDCITNDQDCFRKHCISANGVQRPVKVVNRMLPGPSIQVCQGDTVIVNLNNKMHTFESTTIHWHGIKQKGSPHMDGVGMITQCPITPHTQFEYKFNAADVGTQFWHAHSAAQRADGIFGALVVRSVKDFTDHSLYDYDLSEHIVVVNDWLDQTIISKFTKFLHDFGDESISGILINGRGVNVADTSSRYQTPRAEFSVEQGKRYRFRVINAGVQYCPLQVSVDHHILTVIATDGNRIEPLEVVSFFVLPGERLDFVLNANQKIANYWIRVKGHADCEENGMYQTAVLRYSGNPDQKLPADRIEYSASDPITEGRVFNQFNTQKDDSNKDTVILIDEVRSAPQDAETVDFLNKIKQTPDKKFYLALDMNTVFNTDIYDNDTYNNINNEEEPWTTPQINNQTFRLPNYPLIFNRFPSEITCDSLSQSQCQNDPTKFCKCLHTLQVNLNDVVEVIVVDGGSQQETHPIHLHGNFYAVLGTEKLGDAVYMDDIKKMDSQGLLKRNLDNPPLKDTTSIPSGGYTIFRFYANNPGIWFVHCHIEFHSESGMALIFRVVGDKSEENIVPKPDNWPVCQNFNN